MTDGLSIRGLEVVLGGHRILERIDLDADAGEMLVLAGPSGSGKSTLLRAIAGLAGIAAGHISWAGRALQDLSPGRREIAMVFQDHALLPHLDVADNLTFGLRARGCGRAEARRRGAEVAARLGLQDLLSRRPAQLSGGERQRVALGRALLRDARIVLMDEPLSSLDVPLRARMRREILDLHRRQGWTTLYVTHDQAEALAMADRLGVLQGGKLLQLGAPRELYENPASLDVARFLGSPPINLLPARARGRGDWELLGQVIAGPRVERSELQAGIRPEAVHLTGSRWAPAASGDLQVPATVARIEHVGEQQFVELQVGDALIVVRQEPERVLSPGQSLELGLNAAQLRWFDPQSGAAL